MIPAAIDMPTTICRKHGEHQFDHLSSNLPKAELQFRFCFGRSTTIQPFRTLDNWTSELDEVNENNLIHINVRSGFTSSNTCCYNDERVYSDQGTTLTEN